MARPEGRALHTPGSGPLRRAIFFARTLLLPLPPACSEPKDVSPKLSAPSVDSAAPVHLPRPEGSDVWLDRVATSGIQLPGVPPGAVRRMQVLLFRPAGDTLKWTDFAKPDELRDGRHALVVQ